MVFFHKCTSAFLIIFFLVGTAFYWSPIDIQNSVLIETDIDISPITIVLWTGLLKNHKKNALKQRQLARLENIVNRMKKNQNEICRDIRLDGKNIRAYEEESGYCEFSLSSTNETVVDADVIAFFMFNNGYKKSQLPYLDNRSSEQIWVMYAREPPPISYFADPLRNVFNWTMSYRRDSDVWTPYGKFVKRNSIITKEAKNFIGNLSLNQWISGKAKLIFGVISNCRTNSLREKLIQQMNQTGILVDVFGRCGQRTCGRFSPNCSEDWNAFAKQYKFYMSFENSLCMDYITEKFWRALDLGIVPVVYGGGNYEFEAPPSSYIDVRNFKSVEALMTYLKYLDQNPPEYAKYFEWRCKYKVQKHWSKFIEDWCSLCRAVKSYRTEQMPIKKSYENIKDWWKHQPLSKKSACVNKPKTFFLQ